MFHFTHIAVVLRREVFPHWSATSPAFAKHWISFATDAGMVGLFSGFP